jgi:hypothetical protein
MSGAPDRLRFQHYGFPDAIAPRLHEGRFADPHSTKLPPAADSV